MGQEASRCCRLAGLTRVQRFRGGSSSTVNHIKATSFQGLVPAAGGGAGTPDDGYAAPLAQAAGQEPCGGADFDDEPRLPLVPEHGPPPGSEGLRRLEDGETKMIRRGGARSPGRRGSRRRTADSPGARSGGAEASKRAARPLKNDLPQARDAQAGALGGPFPRRPLACRLSARTWARLEELFRLMDQDGSNAVTREEARAFFKGAFSNLSADAMFNEVDVDGSGAITSEEFVRFWLQVRGSGYKEQDILDEVGELIEGGAWVDWQDSRDTVAHEVKFPKRPILCRLSGKCWKKCEELFHAISGGEREPAITREKAQQFFKGAFCNISADAMFNEIDLKRHGVITPKEFMAFWVQVRASGYKERDILEEIDNLMEGNAWVDWKDGRRT